MEHNTDSNDCPCDPIVFKPSKITNEELKEASMPMIKLLNEKCHPHMTVLITPTSVELLEGQVSVPKIFDHVKD